MSNRVRPRGGRTTRTGRSYAERVQRTRPYRPPRQRPEWLTTASWMTQPGVPALLILVAEVGHLAAAWTEWPASAVRGLFHVVVAGILGVAAVAIYFGPAPRPERSSPAPRPERSSPAPRPERSSPTPRPPALRPERLGIAAALLVPLGWAVGALAGLTPYLHYPVVAAAGNTAAELVAAALLALGWLTLRRPHRTRRR